MTHWTVHWATYNKILYIHWGWGNWWTDYNTYYHKDWYSWTPEFWTRILL